MSSPVYGGVGLMGAGLSSRLVEAAARAIGRRFSQPTHGPAQRRNEAVEELGLKKGTQAYAVIKDSDVMIAIK